MYKSRLHVLIFASGQLDRIGGVQRSYQILTDYLLGAGWKISVFGFAQTLPGSPDNSMLAYPLNDDVNVENITKTVKSSGQFEQLVKKVKAVNPDVILVVNSARRAFLYTAVARYLNIPVLYSMRGSTEYCLRYLWSCREVLDMVLDAADMIHLLMPSYKNVLKEHQRESVITIPSQIEPASVFGKPDQSDHNGRYKILYSGRLSFEKQLHFLLEAYALLRNDFPDWDLQIVGSGPLEDDLKKRSRTLGLENAVEWLSVDNTEEMYQLYPKANIKVLPSSYEGCPMALREAMAHGLPVIAYDTCSGSNEIIEHGHDGLLARSDDPVKGLYDAIVNLILSPTKRAEYGRNGIVKAREYLPEPINRKWERLLLQTIEKHMEKKNLSCQNAKRLDSKMVSMAKRNQYANALIFPFDNALYNEYREEYLTIFGRRLFNDQYYLQTYPEVKIEGVDPLLHYLSVGWKKGFNPSPEFDGELYLSLYCNGKSQNINPLFHFYTVGAFEGCFPFLVDDRYYEEWPDRRPGKEYSIIDDLSRR
ncbi:glycosyltransferase [Halomonas profundus]|nr:glycosyltransferase [Halomonas profundus]